MSTPLDLLDYMRQGWIEGAAGLSTNVRSDQFAAYYSSDCWLAFEAGGLAKYQGLPAPTSCRKSRGYSIRFRTEGGAEHIATFNTGDLAVSRITPA